MTDEYKLTSDTMAARVRVGAVPAAHLLKVCTRLLAAARVGIVPSTALARVRVRVRVGVVPWTAARAQPRPKLAYY